jgi:hypothetical protein
MLERVIGEHITLDLRVHSMQVPVRADSGMLDQIIMNLAINARDAMPRGGTLTIETSIKVVGDVGDVSEYACVTVRDTGHGIPADILPHVFEPFFTTKAPGLGTGLGLATVFGAAQQHGGWVDVSSVEHQGTTFDVWLPLHRGARPAEARPTVRPPQGQETILLVEDEASLRRTTRRLLERRGYRVLEACNGPQALELWRDHAREVALVVTDLVLPGGLSGQELAERLRCGRPDLRVLFTTGYSSEASVAACGGAPLIQKPFASDELLRVIRFALDP